MLNGVKKADRMERTITGVLNHSDELYIFLYDILEEHFKNYSEKELMYTWNLEEDMDSL